MNISEFYLIDKLCPICDEKIINDICFKSYNFSTTVYNFYLTNKCPKDHYIHNSEYKVHVGKPDSNNILISNDLISF